MNFLDKEKRKKYKSQTSKITKKSYLKNNNNNDNKNLNLPNLKGVLMNNFSRNKNSIYNHKNTLSYSSNISKNLISLENKTYFSKINQRTKSFNKSNLMLSMYNKKKNSNINKSNKILSLNLQKKTSKNILTDSSYLNTIGKGKNKNRTIFNIFNTSFKNNSNIFLLNKENKLNNSNVEYKFLYKKSNSNKNLYSINLNSINSSENNSNFSDKSLLTFNNNPIFNINYEKKPKINKINEHKIYLRNLKLSLLTHTNKLNRKISNNFNINNNTNSLNNDVISYSTNLYSSNDNKFLINNNINLKNYNNNNDNNLLNNLNIEIIDKKISEKNINFLNKLKFIDNKNHNFVKDLSEFKEKMLLNIDNKIDKHLKYDSKQIYFDFFNVDKKKKEKEINKNNALKILRLNYLNSIDNQNLILKNEMNKIEKLIYKQKKTSLKKNNLNYFINHQIIFHLINIFYDKLIYNQILKYFNINKTFSYSSIISKTLRSIFSFSEIKNFYNFINHFKNFEIEYFFQNFERYYYQTKRSSNYNNTFIYETEKIDLEQIDSNRKKKLQTIKYRNPSNLEKHLHFINKKSENFIRKYNIKDFFKTQIKKTTKKSDLNNFCLKKNFFNRNNDKIKEKTLYIKNLKLRPTIKIQNINFHVNDQQADMQKNKNMTKESLQYRTEELKMELKKSLKTIEEILFFLIKENNIREFKNILERFQVNINSTDKEKNTFLIFAVQCNSFDLVNYLIEKGTKINEQNIYLNTALHYALLNQNYAMADLLIKNGADEKIKNSDGLIPWQMNK